ncbi:Crp/Fnr family transcriptional regulator [Biformimicrobium ophioploci]|uniref:Helix-turn-helix domain-containing protein n=1 Tax=Biformimicrobium ophioploci TaxID=3036711 RepID=A0ABQ6LW46_9GAMM|nr:Crp/Fnr family transcriptional regulator [Microbulbifer sp. NKW57]GMG86296.1 helix-turn-helix domain-containing protein [Microbulbifer sp. NKW57]
MVSSAIKPPETFFHSKLFRGLGNDELALLAGICQRRRLPTGEQLFRQYSPAQHVYVVVSGTLMIERLSRSGRRQVIAFAYPGDYIGFTNTDDYEYSVVCLREAELQTFPRRDFLQLVDRFPTLKTNARQIGGNVLAQTLDQLFALGQKKAHERLCFLLAQIGRRQCGTQTTDIELIMSRQDIADYLGLTIETVSRAFARLKTMGIIEIISAHRIHVLDRSVLEELASVH